MGDIKKNYNFLIVDDSTIARKKLLDFVQNLGYKNIDEAEDGLIAVNKFKEKKYDYIIMDLEMPNMKGNEASKRILQLNPNIKIILVTSIIDKKELIGALNIGVKKILRKPVSFQMFEEVISELIAKG